MHRSGIRFLVLGLLVVLLPSCSPKPGAGEGDPFEGMSPRERVAQLIWLGSGAPPGDSARWGGIVLDTRDAHPVRPPPVLVAAALERGVGEEYAGTEFPHVLALAGLLPPGEAEEIGRLVGQEARARGIHVGLVPGLPTNDSSPWSLLSRQPERTGRGMAAYLRGLREGGVLPVLQMPLSEGEEIPTLRWDRARWETIELPFLRAMMDAGIAAVQPGALVAPGLTGDTAPLPLSESAVRGLLRRDLGWDGPVAVDIGASGALGALLGEEEAAVRAVAAGADLLLGAERPGAVADALLRAVSSGRLSESRVHEAGRRVLELRRSLPALAPDPRLAPERRIVARDAHARTLVRLGTVSVPEVLVTPAGWGDTLAAALAGYGVERLEISRDATPESVIDALRGRSVLIADAPDARLSTLARRVEREGGSSVTLARFLPGATGALPEVSGALLVWGTGAEAQHAVAEAVRGGTHGIDGLRVGWPPSPTLRASSPSAVGMSAEGLRRVDEAIEAAIDAGVFPGATIAVGRRGGLVRLRGYGRQSREPGAPEVDARSTLYDLASLTKVVGTTTAVMALVDRGEMELDAPLQRYIPEWRGGARGQVTVRHLLTHASGLPAGAWLFGSAESPAEALRQVLGSKLKSPPGEVVRYSDFGMILLAEAVRRVTGDGVDRLLAREVYAPLGMSSTMFMPPLALREEIAPSALTPEREFLLQGVVHDANAFRLGGVAGHAGLFSTARDAAVFAQMMLNRGSYGTLEVISPGVVDTFTRRQLGAEERALGWDTPSRVSSAGDYFSSRAFGHTGYTGTSLWIDPERDLFVVLLTNRTYDRASAREVLEVRQKVHDAVVNAIEDVPVRKREGAR